jgi:hypothetical protein
VIEDGSPYMRSGKQGSGGRGGGGGGGKGGSKGVVDDQGDDQWSFSSLCKKDFVKDSIPDQQLGLAELTIRFKGQHGRDTPHQIINESRGSLSLDVYFNAYFYVALL